MYPLIGNCHVYSEFSYNLILQITFEFPEVPLDDALDADEDHDADEDCSVVDIDLPMSIESSVLCYLRKTVRAHRDLHLTPNTM